MQLHRLCRIVTCALLSLTGGVSLAQESISPNKTEQRTDQRATDKKDFESDKLRRLPKSDESYATEVRGQPEKTFPVFNSEVRTGSLAERLGVHTASRTNGGVEEKLIYQTDGRPVSQVRTPYGTYCVRHRKPGELDALKKRLRV